MEFFAGLGLGLSLIVAIGAQNVFVLRQGLRKEHVWVVVAICAVSDLVLIIAGVSGLGVVVERLPWLEAVARYAGAAFLAVYGALAARRALSKGNHALDPTAKEAAPAALWGVAGTAVALTWLNPHVYLDTVFLLGSIASSYGDARWLFAAGAGTGSLLWFTALGYGARFLSRWLVTPRAWKVLDGLIALVMWTIAVSLVLGA